MSDKIDDAAMDTLFREARTFAKWEPRPVSDDTLRTLYDILKWGPTSANGGRNSSLQGAYLIIAAGALGLDCGPMSGFDQAKVDEEFFGAGKPRCGCDQEFFAEGHVKSNFLCNLGYGDPGSLRPRLPRLPFNEACSLL